MPLCFAAFLKPARASASGCHPDKIGSIDRSAKTDHTIEIALLLFQGHTGLPRPVSGVRVGALCVRGGLRRGAVADGKPRNEGGKIKLLS